VAKDTGVSVGRSPDDPNPLQENPMIPSLKTLMCAGIAALAFSGCAQSGMMKDDGMAKDGMMKKDMSMQECKDHMAMASKDDMMKKDDAMMKKDSMCADMMKK
jgi:hypothetical protein